MLLNPAYLLLFVDLTRSFIQARKLVGFFKEQSLQIGGIRSFYKAMSDKAGRFPLVKCSRAETFPILNCTFLQPLFLINVAWSLTTLNTY